MGRPQAKAKNHRHNGNLKNKRSLRLKRKTKDLDEIDRDLKEKPDELLNQEIDLDAPGFAQHYCLHCSKYFINQRALEDHFKTKVHKRRLKELQDDPYTQEEAEKAAGHGSFNKLPAKRKMETQPTKEEYNAGKRVKVEYYTQQELDSMKKKNRKSLNDSKLSVDDQEMKN
ncbi:hypothetical protein PVAND_013102 [Polypedilum vanderplanki]|uniref:Zinc finger protein 593 homolog n=1 Tax=Polypedilum vanderplanki TaxID=319348 RepID=A0A9J6CPN7_POLVA|nr:hypothetical protein PVAND_013102 [Polypedilum vanderplanki]